MLRLTSEKNEGLRLTTSQLALQGSRLLLTTDNLLKGLADHIILVFPDRTEVNEQFILLDAANYGWLLTAEHFFQVRGTVPGVPDRYKGGRE